MQKVVQLLRSSQFVQKIRYKNSSGTTLIAALILSLFTLNLYAQADLTSKKIDLNVKDASLRSAFLELKKQSGVNFAFSQDFDKYSAVKITVSQKGINVKSAIELLLKNTNLKYTQVDDQVVIDEKPTPKSPNVQAGGGPGTLKGRVVEFETSQPLPGASVYIVELQRGMQSNMDGYYNFPNIPAGKYTLQVSFVSFTTEKILVEIKSGKEETYDVKMRSSNSLKEVVISGTKKSRAPVSHTSERQLVEELKSAKSVVSGISSEQISKSADRNAAEVVRRISGVTVRDDKFIVVRGMNERYNLTYLNGGIAPSTELYSRAFSLDLIPSRVIDRILVYKSPAPDLLGDMTGGAVKIFTKDAKNVKHFDVEFQTGYRENTTFNSNFLSYQGSGTDFLGFDNGIRKLPSAVPGFGNFADANISQKTYVNAFSKVLNYYKITARPLAQLTTNYYNSYKVFGKSLSILTSFSYKNEPTHQDVDRTQGSTGTNIEEPAVAAFRTIKQAGTESQNTQTAQLSLLQNFTYHIRDSSTIYFKNFFLQQGQSTTLLRNTNNDLTYAADGSYKQNDPYNDRPTRDIFLLYQQRSLYSGDLGGTSYLGKNNRGQLDWNGGYTYSRLTIPDQRVIHFQNNVTNTDGITNYGDYDQNWVTVFRDQADGRSLTKLNQGMISRTWTQNTEATYNASLDYAYRFMSWFSMKIGTYQLWKQREVFRRDYTVNEGDLTNTGQLIDASNPKIGAYSPVDYTTVFFHQQDLDHLWSSQYLRDDGTGLKVYDRTNGADAYIATEQNNSGYVAASLQPFSGKVDIYGGLRVEYDQQKVAGAISDQVAVPLLADNKATTYLPSLNINIRPINSVVFRLAYGKTVNRPEFVELSPYNNYDYISNQTVTGNPGLVSAVINNYDARLEFYPRSNKGEAISVGAFYKSLNNPIERVLYNNLNPELPAVATQISFQNAEKAIIKGLEVDLRKNFDFLPGKIFRDISLNANASWIYSKVDSIKNLFNANNESKQIRASRQLQGQAPYVVNIGLYYENAGSGTKIGIIGNQVGPSIYAAALGGDTFETGTAQQDQGSLLQLTRRQLDIAITQRLIKSLQVKISLQNVLNDPVQFAEDANFTYKYEKLIVTPYKGSAIGDVATAKAVGDPLASDYRPGRYYVLTLTYGF